MALFYFKHVLFLCYFKTDIYDIEQQLQLGALVHLVQVDLGVDLLVPASHVVLVQPPEKKIRTIVIKAVPETFGKLYASFSPYQMPERETAVEHSVRNPPDRVPPAHAQVDAED